MKEHSGSITIEHLVKCFGETTAIDDLSLHVADGELLGLLGPNGSGKTTTINVLSTLLVPDAGRVVVGGHDVVAEAAEVRAAISLTGQFAAIDDDLTGTENLLLFAALRGLQRGAARARAAELLEAFGLADVADRRAKTYSGGMRRRLDIAASLVVEPRILFLDEPTTGLDPRSRSELWSIVRRLHRSGMTIVLTTQYLEEADQLADRIVLIDHGRIVATGTPDELKGQVGATTCTIDLVDLDHVERAVQLLGGVGAATVDASTGQITLGAPDGAGTLSAALAALATDSIRIADIGLRRPTLDDVFLTLTQRGTWQ